MKQINVVQEVLKTLVGKTPSGNIILYYLPSHHTYSDSTVDQYGPRIISNAGNIAAMTLYSKPKINAGSSTVTNGSIRPILTLKSDVHIVSGDGKSDSTAYIFA